MTLGSSSSESAPINVILTKGNKAGFQRAFLGTIQKGACNTKFLSSQNGGGGGGGEQCPLSVQSVHSPQMV